jgi:hypothetical protein
VRTVAIVSVLILASAAGCKKGKPNPGAAPAATKVETNANAAAAGFDLPKLTGTPPIKLDHHIDPAVLKKMSELKFNGFNADVRAVNERNLWVYQKTIDRPIVRASIRVWPCEGCWPIDLAKWQEKKEEVKRAYMTELLANDPNTKFEMGETDLAGAKMIWTYQLGQMHDATGHGEFTHTYVLYYNDGVNECRVISEFKDDMQKTPEDMVKWVPREDLENMARAFMDVYTHAWAG